VFERSRIIFRDAQKNTSKRTWDRSSCQGISRKILYYKLMAHTMLQWASKNIFLSNNKVYVCTTWYIFSLYRGRAGYIFSLHLGHFFSFVPGKVMVPRHIFLLNRSTFLVCTGVHFSTRVVSFEAKPRPRDETCLFPFPALFRTWPAVKKIDK
jgi:hypothetical protein